MPIRKELLDEGLINEIKKASIERALEAEMAHHLGYAKGGHEASQSVSLSTRVNLLLGMRKVPIPAGDIRA